MPAFIVAEAGINHLGNRAKMLAFCDAAKACGADAVKFQAYDWQKLTHRRNIVDKPTMDLLAMAELSDADLDAIAAHCKAIGFKHFYSVFDPSQVERVLSRGACALKIGHKEADWRELRDECARRHPAQTWISATTFEGRGSVWCVPEYPATSNPRLGYIGAAIKGGFFGFSSHFTDYRIPAAAALRGAEYIEFHLAMSKDDPEAAWSLMPEDAKKCCELIRLYESWL